ncbi:UDP-xylose and UDP-N-acetylglucosamine transporter [Pseudolycoriella hygida]|uniref:UDP-xylose and UDP-N-acetylglucosamine transporter n=1 Tax=Pseudolycoriella hygida TaxID=35572 RepID=A0A9Q0RWU2_9DIPT|nr:UDP-xylose and UDP-N-acetylglucosamine transporter [Pseudolycoriella hygida]
MNYKAATAILMVFVGCCTNVVFMEFLVKADPGSGNLITFLQFLFIALEGFIFTSKFGTEKPKIAFKNYTTLVAMFFLVSVCNNYAFDFNIPMPLHMIFRAGSLIANMIMGIIILKKKYDFSKYLSVLMITTGIVTCTIVSGTDVKSTANPDLVAEGDEPSQFSVLFWWVVGITLLTVALFVSARMGIYQEVLYKEHGKHPQEALYYTHLLPLPGFLLLYKNIWQHMLISSASEPMALPLIGLTMPSQWVWTIGNVITQYICISSVYTLTTECSSLVVTLVVTLRKFVSLLFSIVYFNNPFTIYHWLGTTLVFVGTIIFTEVIPSIQKSLAKTKKDKKLIDRRKVD